MKIETHCYKYDIVLKKDNHEQWVDIYKINPFTKDTFNLIGTNKRFKNISNESIEEIKRFILDREIRLLKINSNFYSKFKDFNTIVENILNGSNTWIKSKKSFLLNEYEYQDTDLTSIRIHIPFKLSLEEFTIANLNICNIDFNLSLEQRKILLKAFMQVSSITPNFLNEDLKKELDQINLSNYFQGTPVRLNKNHFEHNIGNNLIEKDYKLFQEIENKTFLKSSVGEKVGLDNYTIPIDEITFEDKFNKDISDNPFFILKNKPQKIQKDDKQINSLVLWDIENVNFKDDVSKITSKLKSENQLKIVSYYRKNKSDDTIFYLGNIYQKLNGLKKKKWIVKTSKTNADNLLFDTYYKYKENLKELIIISGDKDFLNIVLNAISSNIKVKILNNANFKTKKWFNNFDYEKL